MYYRVDYRIYIQYKTYAWLILESTLEHITEHVCYYTLKYVRKYMIKHTI